MAKIFKRKLVNFAILAIAFLIATCASYADTCATSFGNAFPFNQATKLCAVLAARTYYGNPYILYAGTGAGTFDIDGLSTATIIHRIGRDSPAGTFQSLVEFRSKKTLVSSGNEAGRGTIRLIDNVAATPRAVEYGYYEFGAGVFTSSLYEMFVNGLSVRNFSADDVTPAFIEARDLADSRGLRFKHDGTNGIISMTGSSSTGISVQPVDGTEDWIFDRATHALIGNATNGGDFVFLKSSAGIRQTPGTLAAAGNSQGTAAAIAARVTTVTASDGTKGVILPTTPGVGDRYSIINTVAAVLKIYPGSGDAINATATDTAVSIAASVVTDCIATSTSQWWCSEGVAP